MAKSSNIAKSNSIWDLIDIKNWDVDRIKSLMENNGKFSNYVDHSNVIHSFGKKKKVQHETMILEKVSFREVAHLSVVFDAWYSDESNPKDWHQGVLYVFLRSNGELYVR